MKFVASSLAGLILIGTFHVGLAADESPEVRRSVPQITPGDASSQHSTDAGEAHAPATKNTEPKADQKYSLRVYRIADLIAASKNKASESEIAEGKRTTEDLAPIMRYIETQVAPATWGQTLKGNATIALYPQNGSLVIYQARHVHDEIQEELAKLRQAYQLIDQFDQIANSPLLPTLK